MSLRASVIAGLLMILASTAHAAAPDSPIGKIEALNRTAIASFQAKDYDKAKSQLVDALVIGKRNDLDTHPVMARTYLHLGVVYLEGLKDREKALRNFALALRIRPSIEVTPALASDDVILEFEEARAHPAAAAPAPPPSQPAAQEADEPPAKAAAARPVKMTKKEAAKAAREAAASEKATADSEDLRSSLATVKGEVDAAKTEALKERQAREHLQQIKVEKDDQLTQMRSKLAEERDAKEALQREKAALEKELRFTKAEHDKATASMEKQLATAAENERKELVAKDKLQEAKAALERQLAEAKDLIKREQQAKSQVEKEKGATEKQLAATKDAEAKERDAKDKLVKQAAEAKEKQEKDRQEALARDKEHRERQEQEQAARQRLAEGPDLPATLPSKVYCPALDDNQEGTDIYVHCATEAKARTAVLYYRTASSPHYSSVAMERSKKGWFTAVVPAGQVKGKVMHYYFEAMDDKDRLVAKEGKASSPNVMTLRPPSSTATPTAVTASADAPAVPAHKVRGRSTRKTSKTR
jgi:hypothetical protein